MNIKKTSLHNLHQQYNAKFVEFAGYEMPIQYKEGIVEEHKLLEIIVVFLMYLIWVIIYYGDDQLLEDLEKFFQ